MDNRLPTTSSLLAVVALAVSCASPPAAPPAAGPDEPTTAAPADFPPIQATRLFPLEPRSARFRITEGPDQGQEVLYEVQRENGQWVLSADGRRRTYLQQNDEGGLDIVREEIFAENVSVEYDPALPLLPARVEPGQVIEGETQVTVRQLESDNVRDRGTLHYRLAPTDYGPADMPGGRYPQTYTMTGHRNLDLNLADVQVDIESVYVPQVGQVRERVEQQRKVLGLFGSKSVTQRERIE